MNKQFNKQINKSNINNSLYSKVKCPRCHHAFISGYDQNGEKSCPSCKYQFTVTSPSERGTNNIYYRDGCPALMSDSRFLTYYNSTNELTEKMRALNGFRSANQFRTFMQNNGNLFITSERNYLTNENTCCPGTACSQGWYDLWNKKDGYWARNMGSC